MLSADARTLKQMGTALRKSQPALYRETQKSLRVVGEAVRQRAASNASWSSRIPGTGKVSAAGVNAVKVSFGGPDAPHAKPIEHAGASGQFRHPLNWPNQDPHGGKGGRGANWAYQDARPFLHPAALDHLQESAELVAAALTVQVEKTLHGQEVFV